MGKKTRVTGAIFVVAAACLWVGSAEALPDRFAYIDMSVGVPELVAVEAEVRILTRWQVGFGYGLLPGGTNILKPNLNLPQISLSLPNGNNYSLQSSASFSYDALTPFLRFFPADNDFYFQLSYTMLQVKGTISTSLVQNGTNQSIPNLISGSATLTQVIPTLAIGNLFTSQLFFINLSLGFSFFYTTSVDASFSGTLPDSLGGTSEASAASQQAQAALQSAVNQASAQLKNEISIIPSLNFAVGFIL